MNGNYSQRKIFKLILNNMQKPININNYQQGVGLSSFTGFEEIRFLNIHDKQGTVTPNNRSGLLSTLQTGDNKHINDGQFYKNTFYVCTSGDSKTYSVSGSWTEITNFISASDLKTWKDYLVGVNSDDLSTYNGSTVTIIDVGAQSPAKRYLLPSEFDTKLYMFGSNVMHSIEEDAGKVFDPTDNTTYTIVENVVTIPSEHNITCVEELNGSIYMGTDTGYLFPWVIGNDSWSEPIKSVEPKILKMIVLNKKLFIQGISGDLYIFDGVMFKLFREMPKTIDIESNSFKNAIAEVNGRIFFAVDSGSSQDQTAVWSIHPETAILSCEDKIGGITDDWDVTFIEPEEGTNNPERYFAGATDKSGSKSFGVYDSFVSSDGYVDDEAYFVSQFYWVGDGEEKQTIDKIEVRLTKPLEEDDYIKVYYRTTQNGAWTEHGTVDTIGATQGILGAIPDLQSIQIKCVVEQNAQLLNLKLH